MKVGIVGGGIAGLVAAYRLARAGLHVTLLERDSQLGGLAGSFPVQDQKRLEKYYHFICMPDYPYFEMMKELGIYDHLRWVTTGMGFFYGGTLYPIGDPLSILAFPHLSPSDKLRFGWAALRSKLRNSDQGHDLNDVSAVDWLISEYGQRAYSMLYAPLLRLKFRGCESNLSAAWMQARMHRLGNSRTLTQKERVGYLDGGTQVYVDALERAIDGLGCHIRLDTEVEEFVVEDRRIRGLRCGEELLHFDHVISTIPIPALVPLLDTQGGAYFNNLRSLEYFDVMVVVLRLAKQLTPYFWTNVSDSDMHIAGIIEYTNLNPCQYLGGDSVLYIPQYVTEDSDLCLLGDEQLLRRYCNYLSWINPDFESGWIKSYHRFHSRFAQPFCQMGFSGHIPPIRTPIDNLYLLDSYQLHPDDRSVSNSTALGNEVAKLILGESPTSDRSTA